MQNRFVNEFMTINYSTQFINAVSKGDKADLRYYLTKVQMTVISSAILTAVNFNQLEILSLLLTVPDINVNYVKETYPKVTALHAATRFNKIEYVKMLLTHPNINPNYNNNDMSPVIFDAIHLEYTDIVELLTKHQSTNINMILPESNSTPLIYAIQRHKLESVKIVLQRDDINLDIKVLHIMPNRASRSVTALEIAEFEFPEAAVFIKEKQIQLAEAKKLKETQTFSDNMPAKPTTLYNPRFSTFDEPSAAAAAESTPTNLNLLTNDELIRLIQAERQNNKSKLERAIASENKSTQLYQIEKINHLATRHELKVTIEKYSKALKQQKEINLQLIIDLSDLKQLLTANKDPLNYYSVLYISPDLPYNEESQQLIKESYRRLSLALHPDKNGGKTTAAFTTLSAAYEKLNTIKGRIEYSQYYTTLLSQRFTAPTSSSAADAAHSSPTMSRRP